ncbi:MAG: helix-turn-helix domain-containing protein [Acidobacteria bacterium]|nr:helix-turn-helix domain-containing protein [Acidobacteriota bacterium]
MIFRTYTPRPPVSHFVVFLWYYEGDELPHAKERILPDGRMELLINLREDSLQVYDGEHPDRFESLPGSILSGIYTQSFVIDSTCQKKIMGVNFKPGGAFPFFKLPANQLQNIHVPLEGLWSRVAGELRERLLAAVTIESRFHLLEKYLSTHVAQSPGLHPAVVFALREFQRPQPISVAAVTEQTGFCARRFIQLFSEQVGLTPKVFCRIQRFHHALKCLHQGGYDELSALAADCGYYDQAHFSHDFKAFSGINPSEYLIRQSAFARHVPITE